LGKVDVGNVDVDNEPLGGSSEVDLLSKAAKVAVVLQDLLRSSLLHISSIFSEAWALYLYS